MQPELAPDEAELRGRNQPPMRHADPVKRAIEIRRPEIEEVGELGETWRRGWSGRR